MKPYVPTHLNSLHPGCSCCVPLKSGHGHKSKRRNEGTERVRCNAKKAMRREGRQEALDSECGELYNTTMPTTNKKLFAVLDTDMMVLATFAEVEDALTYFELTDPAIIVVRTNRALSKGKKCWQWAQTITQSMDANDVDCPKFEGAGGRVGSAPYNEGREYELCKCGAPLGSHTEEVIKASGINL